MPRFRDEWAIDRVLFDYVSGGSCACCGLIHFLPTGTADLIDAISDLDTDQQTAEVAALANHPWPATLRDQVWADRVRLRQKLKLDKKQYQSLWQNPERREAFLEWCWKPETISKYRRWFQLSRTEIMETIQQRYNVHSAFGVVLCTVMEQVAAFPLTEYPPDGKGKEEVNYEKILTYDRRGGFTLPLVQDDGLTVDKDALTTWLQHMEHNVGSPGKQLLVRKASEREDDEADNNADSGDPDGPNNDLQTDPKTSFSSDRRIIRLFIARIWSELLETKFKEHELPQEVE